MYKQCYVCNYREPLCLAGKYAELVYERNECKVTLWSECMNAQLASLSQHMRAMADENRWI